MMSQEDPFDAYRSKYAPDPFDAYRDKYAPEPDGPSFGQRLKGYGGQALAGVAEGGLAILRGGLNVLGGVGRYAPSASPLAPAFRAIAPHAKEASEYWDEEAERFSRLTEPKTTGESVARGTGRIGYELAQYAVPIAKFGSGASKLPAGTKMGQRVMGGLRGAARDAGVVLPVDAVTTAVGPENSAAGGLAALTGNETLGRIAENPATRLGFESLLGTTADVGIRTAIGGVRALRGLRGRPLRPGTDFIPKIEPEPDFSALDKSVASDLPWRDRPTPQAVTPDVTPKVDAFQTVGETVDGLRVGKKVKNTGSIRSSLDDWEEHPGIREVPMDAFEVTDPKQLFYAADDMKRTRELADAISRSGRIDPLIVVRDAEGLYVLEGGHRLGALHLLGKKSFPALVVDELPRAGPTDVPTPRRAMREEPIQENVRDLFAAEQKRGPAQTSFDIEPARTLADNEADAASVVSRLEGKVTRGEATADELDTYMEALSMQRRDEAYSLEEVALMRRAEGEGFMDDRTIDLFDEPKADTGDLFEKHFGKPELPPGVRGKREVAAFRRYTGQYTKLSDTQLTKKLENLVETAKTMPDQLDLHMDRATRRYDENMGTVRSGTKEGGWKLQGRLTQNTERMQALLWEAKKRGLDLNQIGGMTPELQAALSRTMAGASLGGTANALFGGDDLWEDQGSSIKRFGTGALMGVAAMNAPQIARRLKGMDNVGSVPKEYRGTHVAPGREGGAPLHDLTGGGSMYPDDVYTHGVRYYGTGNDALDRKAFAIADRMKGKPDATITVYRAVPDELVPSARIAKLEKEKANILRRGSPGSDVDMEGLSSSAYYEKIGAEIDALRSAEGVDASDLNPGDWVSITRKYAEDHGEHTLNGRYAIISKKVKASDIFTEGNSIHEWGYDPTPSKGSLPMDEASRMARAREQGFTTEGYHGTGKDFDEFDFDQYVGKRSAPDTGLGAFMADKPELAGLFATGGGEQPGVWAHVKPLLAKIDNPKVYGRVQDLFQDARMAGGGPGLRERLLDEGFDGIRVEVDGFSASLKPENIRSRFAKFDPENIGKPDLLGGATAGAVRGLAGAGVGGLVGAAADEEHPGRGALIGATALGIGAGAVPAVARAAAKKVNPTRFAADADVQAVSKGIATGYSDKVVKEGLLGIGQKARREFSREVLPMEAFGRQIGQTEEVKHALAQMRGWTQTATQRVEERLIPIIKSSHDAGIQDVRTLAFAERAIELMDNGLEKTKYTRAQLGATVNKLAADPAIRKSVDDLQAYYADLLQWKLDNGVINVEQFDKIRAKGLKYIPFIAEDIDAVVGSAGGKLYNKGTGVRKMSDKVTDASKVDPFEQAALDTMEAARTIGKQRVANVITGVADTFPVESLPFLERVRAFPVNDADGNFIKWAHEGKDGQVIRVNRDGKATFYSVNDKDLFDSWAAMDDYTQNLLVEGLNKGRVAFQAAITGHPAFMVVNGVRDFIVSGVQYPMVGGAKRMAGVSLAGAGIGAATDEDNRLGGGLKGLAVAGSIFGGAHVTMHIGRTLSALTDILGPEIIGGVIGGVGGAVTADDEQSEFVRFLAGFGAGAAMGKGAKLAGFKGNKGIYDEFLREGGGGFGYYARDRKDAQRMIGTAMKGGFQAQDVLNPKSWWDAIQYVSKAVETAPRLARYKHIRGKGGSVGEGIFQARDLSLDFSVKGRSTKTLAKTVPFLNPAIQGVDKLVRLLGDEATWPVAFATVVAPTLALWTAIHEDDDLAEEYQARQLWERNTYWHIPKKWTGGGDTGFYKMPKPFEVGAIFAALPERILDFRYHKDPEQLKYALGELGKQFTAGVGGLPIGLDVGVELMAGKHGYDFFKNREIDPYPWKDIPAEMQYDEYTSTPALLASRHLPGWTGIGGRSPAKIDHLIKGLTGSIGSEVLARVTHAARSMNLDPRGGPTIEPRPLFARLHTSPTTTPEQERAFRRQWAKAEKAYNGVRDAIKDGNQEEAKRLASKYKPDLLAWAEMKDKADMLSEVASVRRVLWETEELDKKQRQDAIAQLNQNIARWLGGKQPLSAEVRN